MTIEYRCRICKNEVKQDYKSVQCDLCNKWNHIKCVGISSAYYEKLQNDTNPWYCLNCSKELPFSDVTDKDLHNITHASQPLKHFSLMYQIKSQKDLYINSSN